MKKPLALFVALSCCLWLHACTSASNTSQRVKIAYLPVLHAHPLYTAVETKLFSKAGIDIELIPFQAPNQIIDALLAGHVDFGASSTTATGITGISHVRKPNALKIFSLGGASDDIISDILLTHRDSKVNSIEELHGKTLGILPGIQWRTLAKHILAQHQLTERDVEIVDIAPAMQVQALSSKSIDALLSIEPARTIGLSQGVVRDLMKHPVRKHLAPTLFAGCGVVRSSFAQEHPELTKKIIEIFHEGNQASLQNTAQAKNFIAKYTPLTIKQAQKVDLPTIKSTQELTSNERESVQAFLDLFTTYGVVNERILLDELLLY